MKPGREIWWEGKGVGVIVVRVVRVVGAGGRASSDSCEEPVAENRDEGL